MRRMRPARCDADTKRCRTTTAPGRNGGGSEEGSAMGFQRKILPGVGCSATMTSPVLLRSAVPFAALLHVSQNMPNAAIPKNTESPENWGTVHTQKHPLNMLTLHTLRATRIETPIVRSKPGAGLRAHYPGKSVLARKVRFFDLSGCVWISGVWWCDDCAPLVLAAAGVVLWALPCGRCNGRCSVRASINHNQSLQNC
jgi:hypothetical protein